MRPKPWWVCTSDPGSPHLFSLSNSSFTKMTVSPYRFYTQRSISFALTQRKFTTLPLLLPNHHIPIQSYGLLKLQERLDDHPLPDTNTHSHPKIWTHSAFFFCGNQATVKISQSTEEELFFSQLLSVTLHQVRHKQKRTDCLSVTARRLLPVQNMTTQKNVFHNFKKF